MSFSLTWMKPLQFCFEDRVAFVLSLLIVSVLKNNSNFNKTF